MAICLAGQMAVLKDILMVVSKAVMMVENLDGEKGWMKAVDLDIDLAGHWDDSMVGR